ncbi:hypothetical protein J4711_13950 [Staphylococcus epidermidis]|nr:hypothetical protein [Staphylococcus epidermidis]
MLQDQRHRGTQFQNIADVLGLPSLSCTMLVTPLQAGYLRRADLDPELLADLDERLSLWMQLARRYKQPPRSYLPAPRAGQACVS